MMFILLGVLVVLVLWLVGVYNGLISARNRVKESWSDIDVQLKRRYDLIPNLVATVKGYASHESATFEKVTNARAQAMSAQGPSEKSQAEGELSSALKSLFAIAEAYPQLRAVEAFTFLQWELSDTENKIQAARRFYNSNVLVFNTKIESVPTNLIAGAFGFIKQDFFELHQEAAREPVAVSL